MSSATRMIKLPAAAALAVFLIGCDDQPATSSTSAPSSAPAASETTAATAPSALASAPAPASNEPKPSHPCPAGSPGDGTFKSPCVGKGATRLMDVTWTGKITDAGPSFRVVNKAKLDIQYGSTVIYFYDKAGKQLEVPDASTGKTRPKQTCSGNNLFAGPMKAGEKAVLWFSCVRKEHVPEGTVAIEGEMQTVGFTDASGAKPDTFWRNSDLVPDVRAKGGIK